MRVLRFGKSKSPALKERPLCAHKAHSPPMFPQISVTGKRNSSFWSFYQLPLRDEARGTGEETLNPTTVGRPAGKL